MQRSAARQKSSCMLCVTCQVTQLPKSDGILQQRSSSRRNKGLSGLHNGIVCSLGITESLMSLAC